MIRSVTVNGWIDTLFGSTNPQHVFSLTGGNRSEWVMKGYSNQQQAITEILAAVIAEAIGLDVPSHATLFLPEDLILDTPELLTAGFLPGYHVGIEHQAGHDLEALLDSRVVEQKVLARLDLPSAAAQAVGLVVADTAVCNGDHHTGSANRPMTVSGNVSNIYFAETGSGYAMRAIDFGTSFNSSDWGQTSSGDWPTEVLGTVKYFFQRQWLTQDTSGIQVRLDDFYARLNALDLALIVQEVLTQLPQEWRVSNPAVSTGGVSGNLGQADWDDLVRRLERHRTHTPVTIGTKYNAVGTAMWRLVGR